MRRYKPSDEFLNQERNRDHGCFSHYHPTEALYYFFKDTKGKMWRIEGERNVLLQIHTNL